MKELADFSRHQVKGQLLRPGLAKLHALTAHWGKDVFFVGGNLLHLQYVVQRCTKYFYVFLFCYVLSAGLGLLIENRPFFLECIVFSWGLLHQTRNSLFQAVVLET